MGARTATTALFEASSARFAAVLSIDQPGGFPHPALGQDFTLSRATPSAASEHLLELIAPVEADDHGYHRANGCALDKTLERMVL